MKSKHPAFKDARSAEAKAVARIRDELILQIGREPTAAQRMLIDRIALLKFRLELLDSLALKFGLDVRREQAWHVGNGQLVTLLCLFETSIAAGHITSNSSATATEAANDGAAA